MRAIASHSFLSFLVRTRSDDASVHDGVALSHVHVGEQILVERFSGPMALEGQTECTRQSVCRFERRVIQLLQRRAAGILNETEIVKCSGFARHEVEQET